MEKVNNYSFNEISIGLTSTFQKKITQKDMDYFYELTRDANPLHRDDAFAKSKNFKSRVVYGMLISSLVSTLAGVHIPGKNSLILSVHTDFMKPTYVDDTVKVEGKVVEKKDFAQMIKLAFIITNQDNEKVCRGDMLVQVLE